MVSLGSNRVTAQKKTLSLLQTLSASWLHNFATHFYIYAREKKIAVIQKPLQNNQIPRVNRPDWKKMDSTKKSKKTRRRMKKAISHRCLKPCSDTRGRFEDFKKSATCENHQGEEWSHHCRCEAHCSTILGKLER